LAAGAELVGVGTEGDRGMLHHRCLLLARRWSTTRSRGRRKEELRAAAELAGARRPPRARPQGKAGELPLPVSVARGSSAARGAPSEARRLEMVRSAAGRSWRSSRSICSRKWELRRRSGRSICIRKSQVGGRALDLGRVGAHRHEARRRRGGW
jgi:hypothetical protein